MTRRVRPCPHWMEPWGVGCSEGLVRERAKDSRKIN